MALLPQAIRRVFWFEASHIVTEWNVFLKGKKRTINEATRKPTESSRGFPIRPIEGPIDKMRKVFDLWAWRGLKVATLPTRFWTIQKSAVKVVQQKSEHNLWQASRRGFIEKYRIRMSHAA